MAFSTKVLLWLATQTVTARGVVGNLGEGGRDSSWQGPVFLVEPPPVVTWSTLRGSSLLCSAHGRPPAQLSWIDAQNRPVLSIPEYRQVYENGTLYFPPFRPVQYRSDVHDSQYRCMASNGVGTILSRPTHVKAVVVQPFQVQAFGVTVLRGNVALLQCHLVSTNAEHISVQAWYRIHSNNVQIPLATGDKYIVTTKGDLHILHVQAQDAPGGYQCQVLHKLTGETQRSNVVQLTVQEEPGDPTAPRLVAASTSVMAREGEEQDLTCVAHGFPAPNYSWFKEVDGNWVELQTSLRIDRGESVLRILRITAEDEGNYRCHVRNVAGQLRAEIKLTVHAALSATLHPPQVMADTGENVTLNCVTGGRPPGNIQWFKDGRLIQPDRDRRWRFPNPGRLLIPAVTKKDAGMYQCMASSRDDAAQSSAELTIAASSPEWASTFGERTVHPGAVVSLQCAARGDPPPEITWQFHDENIGSTSNNPLISLTSLSTGGTVISFLNFTSARVLDGGEYTCTATNRLGSVYHRSRLHVYGPPTPRNPKNLTLAMGSAAWLNCPVAGYPIVSITWSKDGRQLVTGVAGSSPAYQVLPNGTLWLQQVDAELDNGLYRCQATNNYGQSVEGRLFLTILKPPEIAPFHFPEKLHAGMRLQVTCSIISGDFPLTISWKKDGQLLNLPMSSDLGISEQSHAYASSLLFTQVRAEHSGQYTCVATNQAATSTFSSLLQVKVAPTWILPPQDTIAAYRTTIVWDCHVTGYPTPSVQWHRAGENGELLELSQPRVNVLTNGSMVLHGVGKEDEGRYQCSAQNGIGHPLTKTVQLQVNVPPLMETRLVNYTASIGQLALLVCEARGDAPLRLQWRFQEEVITSQSRFSIKEQATPFEFRSELHVSPVSRQDTGLYRCTAVNPHGHAHTLLHLLVLEPPEAPQQLTVTRVQSRNVGVAWHPPYDGNSHVTHYLLQWQLEGTETWANVTVGGPATHTTLSGLLPAQTYILRLLAVNNVGASSPSTLYTVSTLPEAPTTPPSEINTESGTKSLTLNWKIASHGPKKGPILGTVICFKVHQSTTWWHRTVPTGVFQFTLHHLEAGMQYELLLYTFNIVGLSPASSPIHATTLEGVGQALTNVHCHSTAPQSLLVQWTTPTWPRPFGGVLLGYKVYYRRLGFLSGIEAKRTSNSQIVLQGLARKSNYSVQVSALNAAGEGHRSQPVICQTENEVPDIIHLIKAINAGPSKVIVAWHSSNTNDVTSYNLYVRSAGGQETKFSVSPATPENFYEANNLQENERYEFRVAGVNSAGEGPKSHSIAQLPSRKVPARIATLPQQILVKEGQEPVLLPCRVAGQLPPTVQWKFLSMFHHQEVLLTQRTDYSFLPHALLIRKVTKAISGNYTCVVENSLGRDTVTHSVQVLATPMAPTLQIQHIGYSEVKVAWSFPSDDFLSLNYALSYSRSDNQTWTKVLLEAPRDSYTLFQLDCGTRYQIQIQAQNHVGWSDSSPVLTFTTKGSSPAMPRAGDLIIFRDSTSIALHLYRWPDNGCAISRFTIAVQINYEWQEQKLDVAMPTTSIFDQVPELVVLHVPDTPVLRLTATNSGGSLSLEFKISLEGKIDSVSQVFAGTSSTNNSLGDYSHLYTLIPALCAAITTVACLALCGVVFHSHRRNRPLQHNKPSILQLDSRRQDTSTQLYSPTASRKTTGTPDCDILYKDDSDTSEISPYATFSLAHCPSTKRTSTAETDLKSVCDTNFSATYQQLGTISDKNPRKIPRILSSSGTMGLQTLAVSGPGYTECDSAHHVPRPPPRPAPDQGFYPIHSKNHLEADPDGVYAAGSSTESSASPEAHYQQHRSSKSFSGPNRPRPNQLLLSPHNYPLHHNRSSTNSSGMVLPHLRKDAKSQSGSAGLVIHV